MLGSPASGLVVLALLLLVLATLDGCLAVLTDANFKAAVAQCVGALNGGGRSLHEGHFVAGEDPVAGNCHGSEYGPISGWDVSRVTDMAGLFAHASSFNGNLESWDVSRVETMEAMFALASSFNGNLENWDVSRVRTMQDMFRGDKHSDYGASSFNGNLENWNVSRLETMENMFKYACAFNGNMERWDVSRVRSMDSVFEHALSFNGDLRAWNTMAVTTFEEMFEDTAIAYEMPWNTDGKNTDGMYEGSCVSGNTANCRESCDHVCRLATKTHCTQDFCLCRPWNSSTNETHGTCQPRETYAGTCVGVEPEPQAAPTTATEATRTAAAAAIPGILYFLVFLVVVVVGGVTMKLCSKKQATRQDATSDGGIYSASQQVKSDGAL